MKTFSPRVMSSRRYKHTYYANTFLALRRVLLESAPRLGSSETFVVFDLRPSRAKHLSEFVLAAPRPAFNPAIDATAVIVRIWGDGRIRIQPAGE